jgi:hypothetical protein
MSKKSHTQLALIRYHWIFANINHSATCRPIPPKNANWFLFFCDKHHNWNSSQAFVYFHAIERIFSIDLMEFAPKNDDLLLSDI